MLCGMREGKAFVLAVFKAGEAMPLDSASEKLTVLERFPGTCCMERCICIYHQEKWQV